MLDHVTYLDAFRRDAFRRDAAALAVAAGRGLEAPVPSCPGWTVATLLTHLTGLYAYSIKLVEGRPRDAAALVTRYEDLDLPLELKDWFDEEHERPSASATPPGLLALFEATVANLEAVLWSVAQQEPVWTWWPAEQSAGFYQRRMVQETAIHRWDAQLAHGQTEPIAPEVAADGLEEHFEVFLPMRRTVASAPRHGAGEIYHFQRTDGPGDWVVHCAPDGPLVTRDQARGDVALRGSASDLLLFLWQRIPADRLEVRGDATLIPRYFELAPG